MEAARASSGALRRPTSWSRGRADSTHRRCAGRSPPGSLAAARAAGLPWRSLCGRRRARAARWRRGRGRWWSGSARSGAMARCARRSLERSRRSSPPRARNGYRDGAAVSGAIERFLEAARVAGLRARCPSVPGGDEDGARTPRGRSGATSAQIVKSLVFMADDQPVLAFTSGANRVDRRRWRRSWAPATSGAPRPEEARSRDRVRRGRHAARSGIRAASTCLVDQDLLTPGRDLGRRRDAGLGLPAHARRAAASDRAARSSTFDGTGHPERWSEAVTSRRSSAVHGSIDRRNR